MRCLLAEQMKTIKQQQPHNKLFNAVLKINASIFLFQAAVLPESFRNGKMRLECTATIFNVYNRTTKAIIEEENPRAALVLSTTQDSASSTSKQKNHFMLSHSTPVRLLVLSARCRKCTKRVLALTAPVGVARRIHCTHTHS